MRHISMVFLIVVFVLAGTAAFAQTVCPQACPPAQPVCPAPAPACAPAQPVCPAPAPVCPPAPTCAPACPCPVVPAPASPACVTCTPPSYPAGIGAGPAAKLCDLTGCDFNQAFVRDMYQHHTDIAALATQGIQLAQDKDLRDLSGKIRYEQTKQNQKLVKWNNSNFGGQPLGADYTRVQADMDRLQTLNGTSFDASYAQTMILYLSQARDAAQLGMSRLSIGDLQNQAKIVDRSTTLEINALQRWLEIHAPACVVPPTCAPTCAPTCP